MKFQLEDEIRWGKPGDGQGARLAGVCLVGAILLTGAAVFSNDRGEPAMGEPTGITCAAEDEVIVRLEKDAYDLAAGALFCVHIDVIKGDPE